MSDLARPWTLKGVSEEARSAAIAASDRDDMPIGKWVERAILETIQHDRQRSRAVVPHKPTKSDLALVPAAEVTEAIGLLKQLVDVAGEPPPAVSKAAWAMVGARLTWHHRRISREGADRSLASEEA